MNLGVVYFYHKVTIAGGGERNVLHFAKLLAEILRS